LVQRLPKEGIRDGARLDGGSLKGGAQVLTGLHPQASAERCVKLALVCRDEDISLQCHGTTYMDRIHATQEIGFETCDRSRQLLRCQVANCRVLNVGQQYRFQLPVLRAVDFVFLTNAELSKNTRTGSSSVTRSALCENHATD
jgi:hypothetical protein